MTRGLAQNEHFWGFFHRTTISSIVRGLYQYNKRAEELEEFGIDLYKLAPITELMKATYLAIGVTTEVTAEELMEPGEHWDWGAVLYRFIRRD